ncbi:PPM1J phosphatase, partial [Pseudoatta argentina]
MLNRFKSVLMSAVGASELGLQYHNDSDNDMMTDYINSNYVVEVENKPYSRPSFLGLTAEETQVSADHRVRPIIVPRDLSRLPWCAGYAECINAGKSTWNEDQASATRGDLKLSDVNVTLPYVMFSMFDGHAGYQVALTARLHLHRIIVVCVIFKKVIVKIIQYCFLDCILCDRLNIYVDYRAVLVLGEEQRALTRDHTPDSESNRVRALGFLRSNELLKGHFTPLEFRKRPLQKELGSLVLYREPFMTGVTRGFGDHGLKAANTGVNIKPFLSSQPEVQSLDLDSCNLTERDCIIVATDGLWDVVSDKIAAAILRKTLAPDTPSLEYRLTMGAQELVQAARGRLIGRVWMGKPENPNDSDEKSSPIASVDDISVLVVPLYPYLCEHKQWLKTTQQERKYAADSLATMCFDYPISNRSTDNSS